MCVDHFCFDLLLSLHPTWVLGSPVAYKEPSITPPPSDLLTVEHSQNQTKSRSNKSAQMIWMGYGLIKILIFSFIRHSSRQISGRIKMLNKDLDQRNAAFMKYKKKIIWKKASVSSSTLDLWKCKCVCRVRRHRQTCEWTECWGSCRCSAAPCLQRKNWKDRKVQRTAGERMTLNHVDKYRKSPEQKQRLMDFSHGMADIFFFKISP